MERHALYAVVTPDALRYVTAHYTYAQKVKVRGVLYAYSSRTK